MVHNQLQAKDDCWRIDALYKLQPNKVHSKKMQYMKVHHGEVHHKEVHHEEVQLNLQRHKSDRWEKTTVGIWVTDTITYYHSITYPTLPITRLFWVVTLILLLIPPH